MSDPYSWRSPYTYSWWDQDGWKEEGWTRSSFKTWTREEEEQERIYDGGSEMTIDNLREFWVPEEIEEPEKTVDEVTSFYGEGKPGDSKEQDNATEQVMETSRNSNKLVEEEQEKKHKKKATKKGAVGPKN